MTRTPVTDPDDEILAQLREGNARAFAALVDRHKDRGLTYALRIVGKREEAEEILQDAFMRAYRSLEQFRGESRFGTWFTRILHNLCMTHVTRRREPDLSLNEEAPGGEQAANLPAEEPDPLEIMEDAERTRFVNGGIARLPLTYRQVLTLFYVQELAYEEIVQVTGLPLGTVKTHLYRARAMLKNDLTRRIEAEKPHHDESTTLLGRRTAGAA
jgi:RNA polymerase sigma-70 factor (ECF subfamily)